MPSPLEPVPGAAQPKPNVRKTLDTTVEEALIEMYLARVSVRRVEDITEALWGTRVLPSTVSDLNKKIYGTIEAWRNRPIAGEHPYVYLDGIVVGLAGCATAVECSPSRSSPPRQSRDECRAPRLSSRTPFLCFVQEQAGRHDNYGSALPAQPGRSQGRSANNAGSQPMVRSTCPPSGSGVPLSR